MGLWDLAILQEKVLEGTSDHNLGWHLMYIFFLCKRFPGPIPVLRCNVSSPSVIYISLREID